MSGLTKKKAKSDIPPIPSVQKPVKINKHPRKGPQILKGWSLKSADWSAWGNMKYAQNVFMGETWTQRKSTAWHQWLRLNFWNLQKEKAYVCNTHLKLTAADN